MNQPPTPEPNPLPPLPTSPAGSEAEGSGSIDSTELLHNRREITIRHGEELYRLRLTKSGKLILHK